jgi:hypothetical protein
MALINKKEIGLYLIYIYYFGMLLLLFCLILTPKLIAMVGTESNFFNSFSVFILKNINDLLIAY